MTSSSSSDPPADGAGPDSVPDAALGGSEPVDGSIGRSTDPEAIPGPVGNEPVLVAWTTEPQPQPSVPADTHPANANPSDANPADANPQSLSQPSWAGPPSESWPWSPPPARRRLSSRVLVGLLAVIAFVGGTTVAVLSATRVSSPAGAVERYFEALRDGDAPRALSYGAVPAGDRSFLTSAALAVQNRLAAIGGVQVERAVVSGRTARVPVTYTLTPAAAPTHPSIQTTDVTLHRRGRGWALDRVAAVVKVVAAGAAHRSTLAGVAVPTVAVALFPGVVPLQYDTAMIEQKLSSGYVTLASRGTVEVDAQLSDSGRAAVEAAVRKAFVTCLAHPTVAASRSCPLTPTVDDRPVPGSLRGSLMRAAFDTAPALREHDSDGLIQTSGQFSVDGHYQSLDFDNVESLNTGTVGVTFIASVYATSPGAVEWLPT